MAYWITPLGWTEQVAHALPARLAILTLCGESTLVYRKAAEEDPRCENCAAPSASERGAGRGEG